MGRWTKWKAWSEGKSESPRPGASPGQRPVARRWGLAIALGLLAFFFLRPFGRRDAATELPYSDVIAAIEAGKVENVVLSQGRIRGLLKEGAMAPPEAGPARSFQAYRMEDPGLLERLRAHRVAFRAEADRSVATELIGWLLPLALIWLMWSLVSARAGGSAAFGFGRARTRIYAERDIRTRFTDVAGADEAKAELVEVIEFLKDPARYGRLGARMPKGILLVGPPGTGKTLLARAVAGEANVPFLSINGSEFVELFVGTGAARVRDLFNQAKTNAPCIIFIDELDALGRSRAMASVTGSANDEKEQTLNQLLAELDGFDPKPGVVLLAATNRPEVLDPALLRAGRFDRQVALDRPDKTGRRAILGIHIKGIIAAPDVDLETIAALTTGFSGADLATLVNEAALLATRKGSAQVSQAEFVEAMERLVAGLQRTATTLSPEEKKRVAVHEIGHAAVAMTLNPDVAVQKVSIIPRGAQALGYTLRRPTEDRRVFAKKELLHQLAVLMGGRAAEKLLLDDMSTGAADDLDRATELARSMVFRFGMSDIAGPEVFEREAAPLLGGFAHATRQVSEMTARTLDHEVRTILDQAEDLAIGILGASSEFVLKAAELLVASEVLEGPKLKALKERYPAREPERGERGLGGGGAGRSAVVC